MHVYQNKIGFNLVSSNFARSHYAREIWKRNNHRPCWCLRKTRAGKSRAYRDAIVFEKFRFQNVFRQHENDKSAFSNSSALKLSVFEKLRFPDGLVWTEGQIVEIKLHFQTSPVYCGRYPSGAPFHPRRMDIVILTVWYKALAFTFTASKRRGSHLDRITVVFSKQCS